MSILTRVNEKNNQLIREEEAEKQNAIVGGSRKNNDDKKINEKEFTTLLNTYAKTKSKYDQYYKTLTPDHIKNYKEEFKKQEDALSRCYNLLKK